MLTYDPTKFFGALQMQRGKVRCSCSSILQSLLLYISIYKTIIKKRQISNREVMIKVLPIAIMIMSTFRSCGIQQYSH